MASSLPPIHVSQKTVGDNCFSKHDNRHAFQNSGVYFGQGLGKRPVSRGRRQHNSENHTSWAISPFTSSRAQTQSTYVSDFSHRSPCGSPSATSSSVLPRLCQQDNSLMDKFHVFSKPTFHRFPHNRPPGHPPPPPLSQLAGWFPHEHTDTTTAATSTPLAVLAESQRPFLPHNPWLFSYKSY